MSPDSTTTTLPSPPAPTAGPAPVDTTPILAPGLRASIDAAMHELPAGKRGQLTAGVSLTGVEVGVSQRGPLGFLVGGYAKRLWGGGYEAGARAIKTW